MAKEIQIGFLLVVVLFPEPVKFDIFMFYAIEIILGTGSLLLFWLQTPSYLNEKMVDFDLKIVQSNQA